MQYEIPSNYIQKTRTALQSLVTTLWQQAGRALACWRSACCHSMRLGNSHHSFQRSNSSKKKPRRDGSLYQVRYIFRCYMIGIGLHPIVVAWQQTPRHFVDCFVTHLQDKTRSNNMQSLESAEISAALEGPEDLVICSTEWDCMMNATSGPRGQPQSAAQDSESPFRSCDDIPWPQTQSWHIRSHDLCLSTEILRIIGEGLP